MRLPLVMISLMRFYGLRVVQWKCIAILCQRHHHISTICSSASKATGNKRFVCIFPFEATENSSQIPKTYSLFLFVTVDVLTDIKYDVLAQIIGYIYTGIAFVDDGMLDDFKVAAKRYQLIGFDGNHGVHITKNGVDNRDNMTFQMSPVPASIIPRSSVHRRRPLKRQRSTKRTYSQSSDADGEDGDDIPQKMPKYTQQSGNVDKLNILVDWRIKITKKKS